MNPCDVGIRSSATLKRSQQRSPLSKAQKSYDGSKSILKRSNSPRLDRKNSGDIKTKRSLNTESEQNGYESFSSCYDSMSHDSFDDSIGESDKDS